MPRSVRARTRLVRSPLPAVAPLATGGRTVMPAAARACLETTDSSGAAFEDGTAQPLFADDPVLRSGARVEVGGVGTDWGDPEPEVGA